MTGREIMTDVDDDQPIEVSVEVMAEHIRDTGAAVVLAVEVVNGEIIVRVNVNDVAAALALLRDDRQAFTQLIDLTAVDYPDRKDRFEMIYQLLSMHNKNARSSCCRIGRRPDRAICHWCIFGG